MNFLNVATAGTIEATETVSSCALCGGHAIQPVDRDCNLCCCSSCGYIFDSPRPCQEEIIAFYSWANKYDSWLDQIVARDALWQHRLRLMLAHCAPGTLLDVGTGIGQLLHHARAYFTEVFGTEISESAITIAAQRYGLRLLRGRLEDLHLPDASYDNISLFHVLEHVPDPARLMRMCQQLLRPGGVLVIAVPNDVLGWGSLAKRFGRRLGLPPFRKFSRAVGIARAGSSNEIHLSHFTPTVLRRLVMNCGFAIVEEGIDPYYASAGLRQAAETLYFWFHRLLFAVSGVNRYETIWLVARKQPSAGRKKHGL